MKASTFLLSLILILGVPLFFPKCAAFQPISIGRGALSQVQPQQPRHIQEKSSSKSALFQAKPTNNTKNNKKKIPVPEKIEKESPTGIALLFAYMTPWRNPNSIFVYMFGLLYALGKYSESH